MSAGECKCECHDDTAPVFVSHVVACCARAGAALDRAKPWHSYGQVDDAMLEARPMSPSRDEAALSDASFAAGFRFAESLTRVEVQSLTTQLAQARAWGREQYEQADGDRRALNQRTCELRAAEGELAHLREQGETFWREKIAAEIWEHGGLLPPAADQWVDVCVRVAAGLSSPTNQENQL